MGNFAESLRHVLPLDGGKTDRPQCCLALFKATRQSKQRLPEDLDGQQAYAILPSMYA
jgi:hypothetical protein